MTKLIFNYHSLKDIIIPSIDNTIDSLNVAIEQCSNLSIPDDFKYADYLRELKTIITAQRNNFNNTKNWLDTTNTQLSNAFSDIDSNLNGIPEITIKKRPSVVSTVL